MTYNFDYRIRRIDRTFTTRANCIMSARAQFDQWRAEQTKRVHLMRCWES